MNPNQNAAHPVDANNLPLRNELDQETLDIVSMLENFFHVLYPTMPPWEEMEPARRKLMNEVSRLVIGYHHHISGDVPNYIAITAWLGFGLEHIPSLETVIWKLQQPRIQNELCVNGLATYTFPKLSMNMANPTPNVVTLHEPSNNYIVNSDEKSVHVFEAADLVQAQLIIHADHTPVSGILSYNLRFHIGREGNLLETFGAANPFPEPTNLIALHYNARGAASLSFRFHLRELVEQYNPMIIIITETRLGDREAEDLGIELQYMELVSIRPVGCCGGVWVFSNGINLSLHHIAVGDGSAWLNLLRV